MWKLSQDGLCHVLLLINAPLFSVHLFTLWLGNHRDKWSSDKVSSWTQWMCLPWFGPTSLWFAPSRPQPPPPCHLHHTHPQLYLPCLCLVLLQTPSYTSPQVRDTFFEKDVLNPITWWCVWVTVTVHLDHEILKENKVRSWCVSMCVYI